MKSIFCLSSAAVLAMAPLLAQAHMYLASPKPFPGLNNSPLEPDGSNFPCRITDPSRYNSPTRNQWPVGSSQKLSFEGTAVHAGGSCQVAVTTDLAPTKASKWRMIMSIEGGCPASVKLNLQPGEKLNEFNITVPEELPSGDLTVGVFWFNHKGNREMYSFCAPVSVTGGPKDTAALDTLPEAAKANIMNIGADSCTTIEDADYTFANPGKQVVRAGLKENKLIPLCGGIASGGNGGNSSPGAPSANPATPSQVPASPPAAPIPTSPAPGGVATSTIRTLITITGTPSATSKPTTPANSPTPAPSSARPALSSAPAPSQAPSSDTGAGSSSCATNGAIVCNGPTQFAICNFGNAVWQPVAAGTTCQDGKVVRRDGWRTVHPTLLRVRKAGLV